MLQKAEPASGWNYKELTFSSRLKIMRRLENDFEYCAPDKFGL